MAVGDIIVCMDLGSSKASIVAGQVNKFGEIEVIGYGLTECLAIRKGILLDHISLESSIKKIIKDCEDTAGIIINSSYINVKGIHAKREKKTVIVKVEDYNTGITKSDILNAYKELRAHAVCKGEEIIDIIPVKYKADERELLSEPIGAMCKELTIEADIIISKDSYISQVMQVFEKLGLKIDGVVLETLASGNIVLMPEEKQMGVLLLDIGATTSEIGVYKNDKLLFNDTLVLGSDNITHDIALTLGVSYEDAEKLKKQYNLGMAAMISNNHEVKINKDGREVIIRCNDIVDVIEARLKEIYDLIKEIVDNAQVNDIIECVVITGQGVSNIVGAEEQAVLRLKVNQSRICNPRLINVIKPQQIVAYGMVKYIATTAQDRNVSSNVDILIEPTIKDRVMVKLSKAKDLLMKVIKSKDDEGGF